MRPRIAISCAASSTNFLAIVAKRSFEADKSNVDLAELEKIVGVALLPDVNQNAETVLHYMHPISEDRGFTAEIKLGEVAPADVRTVRNTLNAGATLDRVQRAARTPRTTLCTRTFIRRWRASALARSSSPAAPARSPRRAGRARALAGRSPSARRRSSTEPSLPEHTPEEASALRSRYRRAASRR